MILVVASGNLSKPTSPAENTVPRKAQQFINNRTSTRKKRPVKQLPRLIYRELYICSTHDCFGTIRIVRLAASGGTRLESIIGVAKCNLIIVLWYCRDCSITFLSGTVSVLPVWRTLTRSQNYVVRWHSSCTVMPCSPKSLAGLTLNRFMMYSCSRCNTSFPKLF